MTLRQINLYYGLATLFLVLLSLTGLFQWGAIAVVGLLIVDIVLVVANLIFL